MSARSALTISFDTPRLHVSDWRGFQRDIHELSTAVMRITTEEVMKTLPTGWQGLHTRGAVQQWILEREVESICLAVSLKSTDEMIGIVFVSKPGESDTSLVLHIGYLLASEYWGVGVGSELIAGLVAFSQHSSQIEAIVGGVDSSNVGSVKVLTNNGFIKMPECMGDTHFYEYKVQQR